MKQVVMEWYDGSMTKETVIKETKDFYVFDYSINRSYYAPKSFELKQNKND